MNIFRQGRLVESELGTGNCLVLEVFGGDVLRLIQEGYTMTRFRSMKHGLQTRGWAQDDKTHLWLKQEAEADQSGQLVDLRLDPGGDLTFTFWQRQFEEHPPEGALEYSTLDEVVSSDPANHLEKVGVDSLAIAGAWILGEELKRPGWLSGGW